MYPDIPQHGGDVRSASERFQIPVNQWLDLSTGINPHHYPIPDIPSSLFHDLPGVYSERLMDAGRSYYGCQSLLAAAGSQRFIELLPGLRERAKVLVPDVGYREHAYHWQRAGHHVVSYNGFEPEQITALLQEPNVKVVVLINPCNPTAARVSPETLHLWRQSLAERGGWLIIDEAFMDLTPEYSFAGFSHLPGVIVLRSLGKFFGLAGLRVGFALAADAILDPLSRVLGPWGISGPSQYVALQALSDTNWQRANREQLLLQSQWLEAMLRDELGKDLDALFNSGLFVSVQLASELAGRLYNAMAERGILLRHWRLPLIGSTLIRLGLVGESMQQRRLVKALRASVAAA